ncbi:MAG: hypothetical protein ACHQ8D_07755 [Candidatus Rokuibacteriota bacterium]
MLSCLVGATSAHSEGAWVLWARTCNVKTQTCTGPWRRRDTYEAERWCRAARTTLVNQAFTQEGRETAETRGTLVEYQCLPGSVDPPGPTGK